MSCTIAYSILYALGVPPGTRLPCALSAFLARSVCDFPNPVPNMAILCFFLCFFFMCIYVLFVLVQYNDL